MYFVSSEMKCSTDVNSCKYSNSVFNMLKKFSAQALSIQLSLLEILCYLQAFSDNAYADAANLGLNAG